MDTGMTTVRRAIPWNKGKLPGQKPPAEVEENLDWIALREQTAVYVDRILRGADPARAEHALVLGDHQLRAPAHLGVGCLTIPT